MTIRTGMKDGLHKNAVALRAVLDWLRAQPPARTYTAEDVGAALYRNLCGGHANPAAWAASLLRRLHKRGLIKRSNAPRGVAATYWCEPPAKVPTTKAVAPKKEARKRGK